MTQEQEAWRERVARNGGLILGVTPLWNATPGEGPTLTTAIVDVDWSGVAGSPPGAVTTRHVLLPDGTTL